MINTYDNHREGKYEKLFYSATRQVNQVKQLTTTDGQIPLLIINNLEHLKVKKMRTAHANQTYTVLALDEDLSVVTDYENTTTEVEIDQLKGDKLEVWKEREDGFLFVYCHRLEIGYWVVPTHISFK